MKSIPKITLKMSAREHSLNITEGETTTTFDLSTLRRAAQKKIRRMTVGALEVAGYFQTRAA